MTHRDYAITGSKVLLEVFERRVDVTSPGTLPNHMTVERVRAGANPRSRNESLAHFMAAMGFMEQRGRRDPDPILLSSRYRTAYHRTSRPGPGARTLSRNSAGPKSSSARSIVFANSA